MTRKLTVEIPEEVAAQVEAEAERLGTDVNEVVRQAVISDLGWRAVARIQEQFDLDEESALRLAYEELDATRADRRRSA
jgi:ribbon-helix-helix CopG family protein